MAGKILVGVLVTLSLLLASCYPQLSVQQYDQLRKELAELDAQRQALEAELTAIKVKRAETLAYIEFLDKLVSTQESEMILSGQFDVGSLIDSNAELRSVAETLRNNEISYYLGLMNAENESQMVTAYYKVIEYCLKKIKQNLE